MKKTRERTGWIDHHISFIFLAVLGFLLIFISTQPWGAGLTNDSIGYIGAARHLIVGEGVISYDGNPLVVQPPLYPVVLALIARLSGSDPLTVANLVNGILFGCIVFLGGWLIKKILPPSPPYVLLGTLTILFSIPIHFVSVLAWSEPLFICFATSTLLFARRYTEKQDMISLVLMSTGIALACMTRYIGITLILWGFWFVLKYAPKTSKVKYLHLGILLFISALPAFCWIIRNVSVSGTLIGPRVSSTYSLSQNLGFAFYEALEWFVPGVIVFYRWMLIVVSAGAGLFVGWTLQSSLQTVKQRFGDIKPSLVFMLIYALFLIFSSTTTSYDRIGHRLLSPIYIPLILCLLTLFRALVEPYRERFSPRAVNTFLIVSVSFWLVYPTYATVKAAATIIRDGQGYSGKAWKQSETIQYLSQNQHQIEAGALPVYSNVPEALYILLDIPARLSPWKTSQDLPTDDATSIEWNGWYDGNRAWLVLFNETYKKNLLTIDELESFSTIELIAQFTDAAVYAVENRNQ